MFSIDWTEFNFLPCTTAGPEWEDLSEGFYEYTDSTHPCFGCKFKIVYATRFNEGNFEIIILDVSLVNGTNCNFGQCSQWNVKWGFYRQYVLKARANSDPSFIAALYAGKDSTDTLSTTIYSTAKCFDANENECEEDSIRCCMREYKYMFKKINYYWELTYYMYNGSEEISPPCPQSCPPDCDQSRPLSDAFEECVDWPCPFGVWRSDMKQINLSVLGCPDCIMYVHYRYRKTVDCDLEYKDYFIDSCTFSSQCANCTGLDEIEAFQYAVQTVLKFGANDIPERGYCDSTYRVANASCWKVRHASDTTLLFSPCPITACCWARYLVCKEFYSGKINYTKLDNNFDSVYCNIATRPCAFVCDIDPAPKISLSDVQIEPKIEKENHTSAIPNPSNGQIELSFRLNSANEVRIDVYGNYGILVKQIFINYSGGYYSLKLDFSTFASGIFYYNIIQHNQVIISNKFLIIK